MSPHRNAIALSIPLLGLILISAQAISEDSRPQLGIKNETTSVRPADLNHRLALWQDWKDPGQLVARLDLPRRMRLSSSRQPLRSLTLASGDRLMGEVLEWQPTSLIFRLLGGQILSVRRQWISSLTNPPGEVDVVTESFEESSSFGADPQNAPRLDKQQFADGKQSLKIAAELPGFQLSLDPPLNSSRIELQFRIDTADESAVSAEFRFEWQNEDGHSDSIAICLEADRSVSIHNGGLEITKLVSLRNLHDDWHSLIALLTPESGSLIINQAQLCRFSIPQNSALSKFEISRTKSSSNSTVWIDALQVRRISAMEESTELRPQPRDKDAVQMASGDVLFGRLVGTPPMIEILNQKQPLAETSFTGLFWRQPSEPIAQADINPAQIGLISTIELQPFSDRPGCEPERITGTITRCNHANVVLQHSLIGEVTFAWTDIARITPLFFGQSYLLDAGRFHLGNARRTDFIRPLPDGIEITFPVTFSSVPNGRAYLSLEVADLDASGPNAPIASPNLAELRAGKLVTQLIVNDQLVGPLNAQLRFKARAKHPERLRIEIPQSFLKPGPNSIRLRQQPRSEISKQYDDCEIEQIRLEFEE